MTLTAIILLTVVVKVTRCFFEPGALRHEDAHQAARENVQEVMCPEVPLKGTTASMCGVAAVERKHQQCQKGDAGDQSRSSPKYSKQLGNPRVHVTPQTKLLKPQQHSSCKKCSGCGWRLAAERAQGDRNSEQLAFNVTVRHSFTGTASPRWTWCPELLRVARNTHFWTAC